MSDDPYDNPRYEGNAAYDQHQPREACPYPEGSVKRREWLKGWDETEKIVSGSSGDEDDEV